MRKRIFDPALFKSEGEQMLELIARLRTQKYSIKGVKTVEIRPTPKAGFLRRTHQEQPPEKGCQFKDILDTLQKQIFPNLAHWQSNRFFAYYPSYIAHVACLSELFIMAFHSPSFSYSSSPSHTELETLVMDWCVKALDLPQHFLFANGGGGMIANTNSESQFYTVHVAKYHKLQKDKTCGDKLVGYYSSYTHIASTKALSFKDIVHTRKVPCVYDSQLQNYVTDYSAFEEMLQKDIKDGLIPFWYGSVVGSTGTCALDDISILGPICRKHDITLCVDSAYYGNSFFQPTMRAEAKGLEYGDYLLINFSKATLVGNSGSLMYIREREKFIDGMSMGHSYYPILGVKSKDPLEVDYKDWSVALGRRMNALKIYFILRYFGTEGLQLFVNELCRKNQFFVSKLLAQGRFRIHTKATYGLVTFQGIPADPSKDINEYNREVAARINKDSRRGYLTPSEQNGDFFLRVSISNCDLPDEDLEDFVSFLHDCL